MFSGLKLSQDRLECHSRNVLGVDTVHGTLLFDFDMSSAMNGVHCLEMRVIFSTTYLFPLIMKINRSDIFHDL